MFTNNYDIIIVGGGISGLFMAYKLSSTDVSILLVEKQKKLGGRIQTLKKKQTQFEAGAARFHSSHQKVFSLIDELDLSKSVYELPSVVHSNLRGKERNYHYKTDMKLDLQHLFKLSFEKKSEYTKEQLVSMTFFEYLQLIFDNETVAFMKDSFGYDSEFLYLNSLNALEMFSDDFFGENKYYVLTSGLSSLIQSLESEIKKKKNVTILKNTSVDNVFDSSVLINEKQYYFGKLLLTTPIQTFETFDVFENSPIFSYVHSVPLLRIYAKYPVKQLWFKNIKRTTTDNILRHIIPIDYEKGLIMISYTDGMLCDTWNRYNSISEEFLIKVLHEQIEELYSIEPPKPEFISYHYWTSGVHFWKPNYDMNKYYESVQKPFDDKQIYICGETFSKKQGWIEGALESCYDLIGKLELPGVIVNRSVSNSVDSMSIDEVLKNKNLIVFEVDGQKKIYDVSKWFPIHPGGKSIMKGIKAVKYYKDKKGMSPTEIFKLQHGDKSLKPYLNKYSDYVRFVGILNES
jgi:monoamine oxidase